MSSTPSWDLFIILFFVVGMAYGFILQREKIVVTMVSIYVALVVTAVLSNPTLLFFQGDKTILNQIWVRANTTPFTVQTGIFVAIIILLSAKSGITGAKGKGVLSPIELFGYSFLSTALILSSIFSFLPPETKTNIMNTSKFANMIVHYHGWWVVLPVVLLVVTGLRGRRNSSSED